MLPLMIVLLILPLIAIGLVIAARRSQSIPRLARGLTISGIIGAVLTALFVFMRSIVPIAPYETGPNAWTPIYGQCLLSLYVGFGLGVVIGAIVVSPFWLVKLPGRKKQLEDQGHDDDARE